MQTIAFVLVIVAIVLFLVEAVPRKNYLAYGLAALAASWMVQTVWQSASTVVIR